MLFGLEQPTSGEIRVNGEKVNLTSPTVAISKGIGMVHQHFMLVPSLTVAENMVLGMVPKKSGLFIDAKKAVEITKEYSEKFNLHVDPDAKVMDIPVGMKQKVEILKALVRGAKILILDEPTAGLDPAGRESILENIRAYQAAQHAAVVMVSHSMEDIAKYANRVLVMHRAEIAMYDTVEKVFAHAQQLLELGLSVPQVTKIFLKLREMGVDVPADVYTIPYAVKTLLEAKRRRDAGESLVLPRSAARKGGAV